MPPPRLLPARRLPTTPPSRSTRRSRYRRRGACCLGHRCRYRHYRRHPRRGGRRRRDGYRRQRFRCRGSQRRQRHRYGCCRRGEGWQRHAPPAAPLRPQDAGAARQGGRPRNTRRVRGCSCTALPIPVLPLCSASQLARIAYGSAEPQLSPLSTHDGTTARDDPRGS